MHSNGRLQRSVRQNKCNYIIEAREGTHLPHHPPPPAPLPLANFTFSFFFLCPLFWQISSFFFPPQQKKSNSDSAFFFFWFGANAKFRTNAKIKRDYKIAKFGQIIFLFKLKFFLSKSPDFSSGFFRFLAKNPKGCINVFTFISCL